MQLLLFFVLISGICAFHQREHRAFEHEIKGLLPDLKQGKPKQDADWRIIKQDGGIFYLRRAFLVKGTADTLRYAIPVALLCGLIIFLQSWKIFAFYLIVLVTKWFVTETRIDTASGRYDVIIMGFSLFGRDLAELPEG